MPWDLGARVLFRAYPPGLRFADPCSKLLPFMAAAVKYDDWTKNGKLKAPDIFLKRDDLHQVETIYSLLREDPDVLTMHVLMILQGSLDDGKRH